MRARYIGLLVVLLVLVVALAGCGGSEDGATTESPAATTPAAESPAAESPAAEWTTVTTLSSTDPTNEMDLHVSEEFTVSGDAQLVLDMPDGGDTDGVIAALLPAGEPITVEAAGKAESATLVVALPPQVVSGLDGSYVLLVTPASDKAWTVEVQTQE
jgi:ABC-type glycerol-3-phosphate transport system substrate-binding protein